MDSNKVVDEMNIVKLRIGAFTEFLDAHEASTQGKPKTAMPLPWLLVKIGEIVRKAVEEEYMSIEAHLWKKRWSELRQNIDINKPLDAGVALKMFGSAAVSVMELWCPGQEYDQQQYQYLGWSVIHEYLVLIAGSLPGTLALALRVSHHASEILALASFVNPKIKSQPFQEPNKVARSLGAMETDPRSGEDNPVAIEAQTVEVTMQSPSLQFLHGLSPTTRLLLMVKNGDSVICSGCGNLQSGTGGNLSKHLRHRCQFPRQANNAPCDCHLHCYLGHWRAIRQWESENSSLDYEKCDRRNVTALKKAGTEGVFPGKVAYDHIVKECTRFQNNVVTCPRLSDTAE